MRLFKSLLGIGSDDGKAVNTDVQVLGIENEMVVRKDGSTAEVSILIRYFVSDVETFKNSAPTDHEVSLRNLTLTAARDVFALSREEPTAEKLSTGLFTAVGKAAEIWGITVTELRVTEIRVQTE